MNLGIEDSVEVLFHMEGRKNMGRICSAILIIALAMGLCACGQSTESTWKEQYDLGVRYLSEGNYEEAVIAFTAAIEIDSKRPEAYVGRGDAYYDQSLLSEDDQNAQGLLAMALADYEQALKLGDSGIQSKLEEIQDALQSLQIKLEAQTLLQALFEHFETNDLDGAKALMRTETYQAMSAAAGDGYFCFDGGDGMVIAVYPNDYYYYGGWDNGMRSGSGLWIRAVYKEDSGWESESYEGMWELDRPNGEGTILSIMYEDSLQLEPGETTSIRTEIRGTFLNGLYHGTIYETWYMNDGDVHTWTPITAIDGIYQPLSSVPAEIESRDYYQDNIGRGEFLVAVDQENPFTDFWDSGSVHRVFGFEGDKK